MVEREYVVMLTRRCNFRCTYCYQTHASVDLEESVLERIAGHIRQHPEHHTRLIFHGGEPLLREDLVRLGVSLLSDERGQRLCEFGIVTNGSRIDQGLLELFARHGFRVSVSFDGCREAQVFRDAASFDRLVENLGELVRLHEAGRIELRVAVTITLDNLPFLARSVAFLCDLGIPMITLEGDHFGHWVAGTERLVEEQIEEVVQLLERRLERELPIPVATLQPLPYLEPAGAGQAQEARTAGRLTVSECSCGSEGAAVIDADGKAWACPMYVPDLGRVAEGRLVDRDAFQLGTWTTSDGPSGERIREKGRAIRREPIMSPKGQRFSIFGDCKDCLFAADCMTCPAASHMPDVTKPTGEVHPLLCRLNMAVLARRHRLRRPPNLPDILRAVVPARELAASAP